MVTCSRCRRCLSPQTNLKIMLKFCEQFGLTPSARSRMVREENGGEKETDEMELLLRG